MQDSVMTPCRSTAQRLEALAVANEVRTYRARLKRQVKAGEVPVDEVLLGDDDRLRTMKVIDLLLVTPKMGRVKANRALGRARVSPSKTLAGITPRQRGELLLWLPPSGSRRTIVA